MYCFLKTCRNQKWSYIPLLQLHKFYDCPYVYLYRDLYFSCGLQLMSSVLSFQTEGLPILKHFFQRRSNSNKLPQVLFIWECVNFSLIFKGQFCQIQDSWLTFFFFFSFSTSNTLAHHFYPSAVSDEKSSHPHSQLLGPFSIKPTSRIKSFS